MEDGGPLLYHCDSEEQQDSFESICRKFRRFLNPTGSLTLAGTDRFSPTRLNYGMEGKGQAVPSI